MKARGFLNGQRVEFEAVVATKAQKRLLSGVKLRENGYQLTLSSSGSYIEKRGTRMNLTRDGKRDMVNLTIYKKIKEANVVIMKGLQGEVAKVKKDVKTMRMGPVPGMNDEMKSFTEEE